MSKKSIIGLILILSGVAWIINLTGLIYVDWSTAFKTLWPLVLIAVGISILADRYKLVTLVVWFLTFAAILGFGIYQGNDNKVEYRSEKKDNKYVKADKTPAENEIVLDAETKEGKLIVELGTVKFNIEDGNSDLLAKLDTNIPGIEQQLTRGEQTVLKYTAQEYEKDKVARNFNLQISKTVPWEIDTTLSVVDGILNLGEVPVKELNLKLGVGDLDLIVGNKQQHAVINIRAGATNLDIYIPKDSGLMVKSGKLLTNLEFKNINMTNQDNVYISDNYEKADQKIEMHIQSAVSAIEIFAE